MKKRVLSLLIATCFILMVFTGCNEASGPEPTFAQDNPGSSNSDPVSNETASGESITLSVSDTFSVFGPNVTMNETMNYILYSIDDPLLYLAPNNNYEPVFLLATDYSIAKA